MNQAALLAAYLQALMDIIRRHFQRTGEILTDAQVKEQLAKEFADGTSTIATWFRENGLEPPQ